MKTIAVLLMFMIAAVTGSGVTRMGARFGAAMSAGLAGAAGLGGEGAGGRPPVLYGARARQ